MCCAVRLFVSFLKHWSANDLRSPSHRSLCTLFSLFLFFSFFSFFLLFFFSSRYRVYVGVDAGDKFFDNEQNEKAIIQWFDAHVVPPAKQIGVKCSLKILLFTNENHKPGPAFNHACLTAYDVRARTTTRHVTVSVSVSAAAAAAVAARAAP